MFLEPTVVEVRAIGVRPCMANAHRRRINAAASTRVTRRGRSFRTHGQVPVTRRAAVLGASMAGLLAARALAEHYEVVIIERDLLSTDHSSQPRRGVPQGRH